MNEFITELTILGGRSAVFSERNIRYVIPLYQRAFAWKEEEITQLIEDVKDFEGGHYYLGSLIVYKNNYEKIYEVIDGQQRLTALFLLLNSLEVPFSRDILTFKCREKSNYTLRNIDNLFSNMSDMIDDERIEDDLKIGKKIVDDYIQAQEAAKRGFKTALRRKLKNVILYRIEVPPHTDLNRYFEIMNTRGEQLEQHDILKAALMSAIKSDAQKELFAKIWDASRDMTGYLQMHFDTNKRRELFGGGGERLNWGNIDEIFKNKKTGKNAVNDDEKTIKEIIRLPRFVTDGADGETDDNKRVRFESIISFPFFLLHTLRVFVSSERIEHKTPGNALVTELLDDKKLVDAFITVIENGMVNGKRINKEWFAVDFIKCLLKSRYLFDKYIIKREFVNDDSDGEWSLKSLKMSNEKAYYANTYFRNYRERDNTDARSKAIDSRNKPNLMLQACLRVSYTSPKVMHWITELLKWLYNDGNVERLSEYEWEIEKIAQEPVNAYLQKAVYSMGTNTPHIVFNYLDYLLWKDAQRKYSDFVFEFRNSVEHWYPRQPSKDTFDLWLHDDGVDDFGNLCIIQRNVNSKFSNLSPEAKKTTYGKSIAKGSLKLRKMADLTDANQSWKDSLCKKHENEMIERLRAACDSL